MGYDIQHAFENKTESELAAMVPPDLVSTDEGIAIWHRLRDAAIAALREKAERKAEWSEPNLEPVAVSEAPAARGEILAPQPVLTIPDGDVADLLERQIGACAALIGNIAEFVAGNEALPDICFPFMDRISAMVTSSANAARVVGQLRGIATQTKQTIVTETWGKGAGGVR
jgi:hypothetical protein